MPKFFITFRRHSKEQLAVLAGQNNPSAVRKDLPPERTLRRQPGRFLHYSTKERVLFIKRLSFLINANIGISESLSIIRNQTKSRNIQSLFNELIRHTEAGRTLATALQPYRQQFGDFTINLIKVGEQTGTLGNNLEYIAGALSKQAVLKQKIKGALIYPIFIFTTTLVITGGLITFLFPKIMPIFTSLDIELPFTTRTLLTLSEFLKDYGIISGIGSALVLATFWFARTRVRYLHQTSDRILFSLPLIGHIVKLYNTVQFCRTVALTLKAGVVLSEALSLTALTSTNTIYKRSLTRYSEQVAAGSPLSKAIASGAAVFPSMVSELLFIAERTGNLSHTLQYLSELYEADIEDFTKNLSTTIEPILLIIMGLLVGLIAISVIMPIYEITSFLGTTN